MSARIIAQSILIKSIRINATRNLVAPVIRSSILLNKGFVSTASNTFASYNNSWKRQYNTQVQDSEVFKVIDYNDIQSIIKNNGKGYHLIDVREPKEVAQGAIPTANNTPLSQLEGWSLSDEDFKKQFGFDKPSKDSSVILYCLGGVRSTKAALFLSSLGYNNLQNYVGSWADYVEKQKGGN